MSFRTIGEAISQVRNDLKEFTVDTATLGVINPTKRYLIHKKGLPNGRGDYGNLYLKFTVDGYKTLTNEQREKLNEIL